MKTISIFKKCPECQKQAVAHVSEKWFWNKQVDLDLDNIVLEGAGRNEATTALNNLPHLMFHCNTCGFLFEGHELEAPVIRALQLISNSSANQLVGGGIEGFDHDQITRT